MIGSCCRFIPGAWSRSRACARVVASEVSVTKVSDDYCEQANPRVLSEMRRSGGPMVNARRIQASFLANLEKRTLLWLAERTPSRINSDHLTALGFAGQVMAGAFYALSRWNKYFLLAVIACLALNWLGDSLDGTLARVRQRQRPRYGFYVDHMVDACGSVFLFAGLALSGYMSERIAVGLLVTYFLLSIEVYLATYTVGKFHLSFAAFGPTELRLLLIAGNVALLNNPFVAF